MKIGERCKKASFQKGTKQDKIIKRVATQKIKRL